MDKIAVVILRLRCRVNCFLKGDGSPAHILMLRFKSPEHLRKNEETISLHIICYTSHNPNGRKKMFSQIYVKRCNLAWICEKSYIFHL